MDNRLKQRFEAARPVPTALERASKTIGWEELAPQEQSAIQRGQHKAMEAFDQWSQSNQTSPSQAPSSPTRNAWRTHPWVQASLVTCTLLLVVGSGWLYNHLQPTATSPWPSLQTQGHARLQWQDDRAMRKLKVEIPAAKTAMLTDPDRWSLDVQGGSHLTLQRQERHRLQVQLRRGSLVAKVTPGSMKAFVVRCRQQFDVVVKGTVFVVRQGSGWLRVEVFRGRVEVKHKRETAAVVNAGEGVRFRTGHNAPSRYRVFRQIGQPLAALLRWMRANAPQELTRYANDIASQTSWALAHRRAALELIANLLGRQRHYEQASRVWEQLYRWQPRGFEGQTALLQAAQQCRRGQPTGARCVRLYRRWLKRFPDGMKQLHEASLVGLIQLLHKRRQRRQRDTLIKRYLKRHPQGIHRRTIKALQR